MKKIILMSLLASMLTLAENDELDTSDEYMLRSIYIDPLPTEYPLSDQKFDLIHHKVISWSTFETLGHRGLIEGQMDGFLKVVEGTIKEGENKGKVVYKCYLYKSKESLEYKRLGSCIELFDWKRLISDRSFREDPKLLNGKYCITAGVFQKLEERTSVLGNSVNLFRIYIKKDAVLKK
ncbi:hypothetical protein NT6N_03980 [Oceaniferula spumae]|uniref:Uncharacterized protein n=1 Tax=Oceaniferula spumae TaxID=2979115 RepID=A0AAT9FH72_9BACT